MKYLKVSSFVFLIVLLSASCNNDKQTEVNWESLISENLKFAEKQYLAMEHSIPEGLMPRSFENGEFITSNTSWWCSGFYPGTLWYLYENSKNEELKEIAHKRTMSLENEQFNTGTHDLGFMLYCSFGNGLRITENKEYEDILLQGAESLISRFNENTGCIQSWDNDNWQYPVIIDNMMNLEFLFWAYRQTENEELLAKIISHIENTIKDHYREDFSSYHLVSYDTINGDVIKKQTVQGYADESAWARGNAWGLYGFVTVYRDTKDERYLEHAINIAKFLVNHPNLPEDKIPYWDFNAPNIPDAKRDASAGAIIASALLELSDYAETDLSEELFNTAKTMIYSLATNYRAEAGENGNFILKHSVGNLNKDSEVDVPLTYADYYFVESLIRLKERLGD